LLIQKGALCDKIKLKLVIVKNFDQLAETKERKLALEMAEAGLEAIDTEKVISETVKLGTEELSVGNERYSLDEIERIFVVGIGKCSLVAGRALEKVLGENVSGGVIIDVRDGQLDKIHTITGDHPYPTEKNVDATGKIISLLEDATEKDLVIFIISGGGSTLLCQPEDMTCFDEAEILKSLYDSSVGIRKINTVRKHLSSARGGYLTKYAYPAKVVSLIFSDVPGDDLEFIASGPTIKDTTTLKDAEKIIKEFRVEEKTGINIKLLETPKEDKYFENVKNILVVSNKIALAAMEAKAKSEGYEAVTITTTLEGEARDVAPQIVEELHKAKKKTIHLYGGETTVTVRHAGIGGRNLELALAALETIEEDELVLALASDGKDNTDFAGAISDMITKKKGEESGLDPRECIENNCSYHFFEKTRDYVNTGYTGRNVADLVIAIKS